MWYEVYERERARDSSDCRGGPGSRARRASCRPKPSSDRPGDEGAESRGAVPPAGPGPPGGREEAPAGRGAQRGRGQQGPRRAARAESPLPLGRVGGRAPQQGERGRAGPRPGRRARGRRPRPAFGPGLRSLRGRAWKTGAESSMLGWRAAPGARELAGPERSCVMAAGAPELPRTCLARQPRSWPRPRCCSSSCSSRWALRLAGFAPERQLATRRIVDAGWTRLLDCYPSNPRGYFEIDLHDPREPRALLLHRAAPLRRHRPRAPLGGGVPLQRPALSRRAAGPEAARGLPDRGLRRLLHRGAGREGRTTPWPASSGTCSTNEAPGRFEVRNCGRRGLDFPELLEGFEGALRYEPDLLVYALVLNDAVRPPEFQARQSYINDWILDRERLPDETAAPPALLRSRTWDLVADRVSAWRVGQETTRWYLDMWGEGNPEGWARTQEIIRDMDRRVNRRGGRFLVAAWPLFVGLEGPYPFAPVHETIGPFLPRRRDPLVRPAARSSSASAPPISGSTPWTATRTRWRTAWRPRRSSRSSSGCRAPEKPTVATRPGRGSPACASLAHRRPRRRSP